jgi:hypothetical protein
MNWISFQAEQVAVLRRNFMLHKENPIRRGHLYGKVLRTNHTTVVAVELSCY